VPHTLFYLSGIVLWTYFADAVNQTSNTFTKNAQLFGKVYFPRIIIPLSVVITNLIKMGVQLGLLLLLWVYFFIKGAPIHITPYIIGLPLLTLLMALLGLGVGLLVSALTTKYRDLQFLIQFAVQLMMYASTVIFPLSSLEGHFRTLIILNPMSSVIETGRYMLLGSGAIPWIALGGTTFFSVVLFVAGALIFNRTEKNFMDTV
jgi:lipopolysaccharide transport system permease protein